MKRIYDVRIEIDSDETDVTDIIHQKFKFDFKSKILDIRNVRENRTSQQRKSLWLWCGQCAEALNEKNFDMRAIIRQDVEIAWSKNSFMEYIFRPLMKTMFNKKSTNQLKKTGEMDEIIDIIVKLITERTKGLCEIPEFPNEESFYRNNQS